MQDKRQPLKKHVCQGKVYVSKSKMTPPQEKSAKNFFVVLISYTSYTKLVMLL